MKIGIDIRCLAEGKRTGVEEYAISLIKNTLEKDSSNEYIFFTNSFKGQNANLDWLRKYPNSVIKSFRIPNKLLNLSMYLLNFPKIDNLLGGIDIFYMPNINFIALSSACRKIITIHDLSFERFPETFSLKRRLWHFMVNARKLCRSFDKIVAVSNSTKSDIISLYGVDEKKIEATFPFLNLERFRTVADSSGEKKREIQKRYGIGENYILFLGTIEPRKNIEGLIDAFEVLLDESKFSDFKLVIAGSKGWKCESIYEKFKNSRARESIVFTDFIRDEDKPYIYSLAKIFVYPSFFEGFGFPPAEAMMAGVPVVTSNCSSLPEVVDDAAILIDPYRPYEIAIAIKDLLEDENVYGEYSSRGRKRGAELQNMERKNIFD